MRNVVSIAFTAVASLAACQAAAATNLLQNGGFEVPAGYFKTYTGTQIPGWTVTVNDVDIASNAIYGASSNYAYEGTQWLDLVGDGRSGAIAQSFATTAGASYLLSFYYANNPDFSPAAARVDVVGSTTLASSIVTHAGSTRSAAGWTLYSAAFVADSASTSLTFTDTSHNLNAGLYLDAVSVTAVTSAVPEPAAWALMVGGFGLVGSGMRIRRRVSAGSAIS